MSNFFNFVQHNAKTLKDRKEKRAKIIEIEAKKKVAAKIAREDRGKPLKLGCRNKYNIHAYVLMTEIMKKNPSYSRRKSAHLACMEIKGAKADTILTDILKFRARALKQGLIHA